MTDKIVVLSTCAPGEAHRIARWLIEKRVAACVNILPGAASVYRWKGEVESATECLLVIKSSRELFPRLREELERAHTYQVPEILALQVVEGSINYLNWLEAELAPPA